MVNTNLPIHSTYLTIAETSARMGMSLEEVERLLECGELDAIIPAQQSDASGKLGAFDYTLLPPEGVRRVLASTNEDRALCWTFAAGCGRAEAPMAPRLLRVLAWSLPHCLSRLSRNSANDSGLAGVPAQPDLPQASSGTPEQPAANRTSETVAYIMATLAFTDATELKRDALLIKLSPYWKKLERDLSEGYNTGLSSRAKSIAKKCHWKVQAALIWADERGRLEEPLSNKLKTTHLWPSVLSADSPESGEVE